MPTVDFDALVKLFEDLKWKFHPFPDHGQIRARFKLSNGQDAELVAKLDTEANLLSLDAPLGLRDASATGPQTLQRLNSALQMGKVVELESGEVVLRFPVPIPKAGLTAGDLEDLLSALADSTLFVRAQLGRVEAAASGGAAAEEPPGLPYCTVVRPGEVSSSATELPSRGQILEQLLRTLTKRSRNSAVLCGPPASGRSFVIQSLAARLFTAATENPHLPYAMYRLDTQALKKQLGRERDKAPLARVLPFGGTAGAIHHLAEAIQRTPKVVLVVDPLYQAIAPELGGTETFDTLARLQRSAGLRVVGTATPQEIKRLREAFQDLDSLYSEEKVEPFGPDDCVAILESRLPHIARDQSVEIDASVARLVVEGVYRHIPAAPLLATAMDVVDEACSDARLQGGRVSVQHPPSVPSPSRGEGHQEFPSPSTGEGVGGGERLRGCRVGSGEIQEVIRRRSPAGARMRQLTPTALRHVLSQEILGQEEAVEVTVDALFHSLADYRADIRPRSVLLFCGPTGVGKTEMCKQLALALFGDARRLHRFDMSEYQDKGTINKLIGSPLGYEDSALGGILTNAVMEEPFSIILFDEIEKADPSIHKLLLQVLDEGRLTDARGRTIDFSQSIIIMTTNRGRRLFAGLSTVSTGHRPADRVIPRQKILETLRQESPPDGPRFPVEFLGRIQEAVLFRTLTASDLRAIAQMKLERLFSAIRSTEARDGHEVSFQMEGDVAGALASYAPTFGVRDLEATIRFSIEYPLSRFRWEDPGRWRKIESVVIEVPGASEPGPPLSILLVTPSSDVAGRLREMVGNVSWKVARDARQAAETPGNHDLVMMDLALLEELEDPAEAAAWSKVDGKSAEAVVRHPTLFIRGDDLAGGVGMDTLTAQIEDIRKNLAVKRTAPGGLRTRTEFMEPSTTLRLVVG